MTIRTDVYRAVTPYGLVEVFFPEDQGVEFSGGELAVGYLKAVMAENTNGRGQSMTEGNLEPKDLLLCCQPVGSGITISEPFDDMVERPPGPAGSPG